MDGDVSAEEGRSELEDGERGEAGFDEGGSVAEAMDFSLQLDREGRERLKSLRSSSRSHIDDFGRRDADRWKRRRALLSYPLFDGHCLCSLMALPALLPPSLNSWIPV